MKIKRYLDKDMRHVLRQVREDQGPDAVILSNRRVEDGIEVIAAIDYDEALMKHALTGDSSAELGSDALARLVQNSVNASLNEQSAVSRSPDVVRARLKATPKDTAPATALSIEIGDELFDDSDDQPDDTASREPQQVSAFKEALRAADTTTVPQDDTVPARTVPAATIEKMQDELSSLRGLLEGQLAGLVWRDSCERYPQRTQVLRNLAKLGIAPDIADMVVNRMPPIEADEVWKTPLVTLAQAIPVGPGDLVRDGGVAALIGPTGVGKTTTIAKIASRFAMEHGTDDIALVSADSYRIGAREHLKAFANIIGVRVHSAADSEELTELLMRLGKKKLVLIDTEGRSQRDRDLAARLAAYGSHADRVHFYLTLSAATQEAGLDEAVRTFSEVPLSGCIVTKIDEAAQLGCMISTAIRHDLPLTWLTDGQRIPDDLHAAQRKRLWLVNQALDCMRAANPGIDERYMAEHYSQASAAHG